MADKIVYLRAYDAFLVNDTGGEVQQEEDLPCVHLTQKPTVRIYLRDEDGVSEWSNPGLTSGSSITISLLKNYGTAAVALCVTNTDITIDETDQYIEFVLNANTENLQTALGTAQQDTTTYLEIQIIPNGDTEIRHVWQFSWIAKNIGNNVLEDPDELPDGYPSLVEIQAQFVAKSLFDANTILAADTDDTPAALTIAEDRVVGRIAGGNITGLTAAQILTLIGVAAGADVTADAGAVMEADYDAYTILAADSDNTPIALTVGASTFVGRKATGGIVAMSVAEAKALLNLTVYRTCWIPAASMVSRATNGAQSKEKEFATNDVNIDLFGFDDTTEEGVQFTFKMPLEWDASHLKAKFVWSADEGLATETVRWSVRARAFANDDAFDQAFGTAQTVDDTFIAQGDNHESGATGTIVPAGTPVGGSLLVFEIVRVVAADDLTGDADLVGVFLQYGEGSTPPSAW